MALTVRRLCSFALARRWKGASVVGPVATKWKFIPTGTGRRSRTLSQLSLLGNTHFRLTQINFRSFFSAVLQSDAMVSSLTPPQPAPSWDHSPQDIKGLTDALIAKDCALLDKVGALKPEECNFESVSAQVVSSRTSLISLLCTRFLYVSQFCTVKYSRDMLLACPSRGRRQV